MSVDLDLSRPIVRRSRRNGHDRAYVKVGGRDVGYRDLISGELRCKQAKHNKLVAAATLELWEQAQESLRTTYRPRHAAPEDEPEAIPA